jgi:hypothetical protein
MGKLTRHALTYGAAVLAIVLPVTFALAGPASASTSLSNGVVTLTTNGAVGTPYSSGQTVTITVGPNSTLSNANLINFFPSGAVNVKAEECSDPGGTTANLPTNTGECQPDTVVDGSQPQTNGSVTISNYKIYDTPNNVTFSEGSAGPTCDRAPNFCVIGIFTNQNSFTDPVVFSAPFQVTEDGSDDGANPGDGTPEVPYALALPLLAAGLVGGTLFLRRRKQRQAA